LKNEFRRFGLEKFGVLTALLEILGALGLLVGFFSTPILLLSSGGLALLMFFGMIARVLVKDSLEHYRSLLSAAQDFTAREPAH
jgi:hypothetical protein